MIDEKKLIEEWKDIPNFEGKYQVSNCGRVRSLPRYRKCNKNSGYFQNGKILKPYLNDSGYCVVGLHLGDNKYKQMKVHIAVAECFASKNNDQNEQLVVNHIDSNKLNNCYTNLEWVTQKRNVEHSVENGTFGVKRVALNNEQINEIRKTFKNRDRNCGASALGKRFGVSPQTILRIVRGEGYFKMPLPEPYKEEVN